MKLDYSIHKPLLFLILICSCATSYGMETCIIPTIVIASATSTAGALCCFYKRKCSPKPTQSYQLPQPLNMRSFSDNQQSTDSDYPSPESIFESILPRENSKSKILDLVDMGAKPCKK